jgi:hypothetical protein
MVMDCFNKEVNKIGDIHRRYGLEGSTLDRCDAYSSWLGEMGGFERSWATSMGFVGLISYVPVAPLSK